jgi:inner membrane protein
VIAFGLGIPYGAPFGHRGASHSLAAALLVAVIVAWFTPPDRRVRTGFLAFAVVASHGLLDALTDGGRGVALLFPASNERFFAPFRPIPVAPIGPGLLSRRGLYVMAVEAVWFLPLFAFALWPRRARPRR